MRVLVLSAAALLAGCAPGAVRPTLDDVHALGYYCDEGVKDNVPSGLYQWKCEGRPEGRLAIIDIDGNEERIVEITLDVRDPSFEAVRNEFRRIVPGIRLIAATSGLSEGLDDWLGAPHTRSIGGVELSAECDASQCIVWIGLVRGPTQPLESPQPQVP